MPHPLRFWPGSAGPDPTSNAGTSVRADPDALRVRQPDPDSMHLPGDEPPAPRLLARHRRLHVPVPAVVHEPSRDAVRRDAEVVLQIREGERREGAGVHGEGALDGHPGDGGGGAVGVDTGDLVVASPDRRPERRRQVRGRGHGPGAWSCRGRARARGSRAVGVRPERLVVLDADLALHEDRAAPGEGGSRSVAIRLARTTNAVVSVPGARRGTGRGLGRRGCQRVELGVGRRRRGTEPYRVRGGDHRPGVDGPAQRVPRVVELAGHRVNRQHSAPGAPRPVDARVVENGGRGVRAGVRMVRRQPRIRSVARPIAFQHHRHRTEGARLGRAQQLFGGDVGDAVVERVGFGRGVAGVRIQEELLAGTCGTVRMRARSRDGVPAPVGVGIVVGRSVHGDRIEIVGGIGRGAGPGLTGQRGPRCDDHGGDLERPAVAPEQHRAARIDQPEPRVCGRSVEETGVDRTIEPAAAAVIDEIARHRVPQRLARPVANVDAQGPDRARRRLPGPGEPADQMTIGQAARDAVGLAVVAARVRVAVRKRQHPGHMLLPAPGEAGPDRPADERLPRVRERPCGCRRFSRPHRRRGVQCGEQDTRAGEKRHRQRRQKDGAALPAGSAAPEGGRRM